MHLLGTVFGGGARPPKGFTDLVVTPQFDPSLRTWLYARVSLPDGRLTGKSWSISPALPAP